MRSAPDRNPGWPCALARIRRYGLGSGSPQDRSIGRKCGRRLKPCLRRTSVRPDAGCRAETFADQEFVRSYRGAGNAVFCRAQRGCIRRVRPTRQRVGLGGRNRGDAARGRRYEYLATRRSANTAFSLASTSHRCRTRKHHVGPRTAIEFRYIIIPLYNPGPLITSD